MDRLDVRDFDYTALYFRIEVPIGVGIALGVFTYDTLPSNHHRMPSTHPNKVPSMLKESPVAKSLVPNISTLPPYVTFIRLLLMALGLLVYGV